MQLFKELKIRDLVLTLKWDHKLHYHQGSENIAEESGRMQESEDGKDYCETVSSGYKMFILIMMLWKLWFPVQGPHKIKSEKNPRIDGMDDIQSGPTILKNFQKWTVAEDGGSFFLEYMANGRSPIFQWMTPTLCTYWQHWLELVCYQTEQWQKTGMKLGNDHACFKRYVENWNVDMWVDVIISHCILKNK